MELKKKITLDYQSGTAEAEEKTIDGETVNIVFSYQWDELKGELRTITSGSIIAGKETVATFAYNPNSVETAMSLKTAHYTRLAEYAGIILNAISSLGKTMK